MIFVIFSIISIIYIFYLYRNFGERSQINLKNLKLVLLFFVITAGLIVVFQIDSGIHLKDEYSKLSERNMKICPSCISVFSSGFYALGKNAWKILAILWRSCLSEAAPW